MGEPKPLSYLEQAKLFQERGMNVNNLEYASKILGQLGYYRIKEVARPLSKVINKEISYEGVSFQQVISRYYQDKNLRVYLLHCIEEVEVSIKTNVAYILGKNGPFKYLNFPYWCNKDEYCKYYLADRQKDFRRRLKSKILNSSNPEISKPENLNNEKFPSIWLTIDVLTFGDVVHLIDLMSKKNQNLLADYYGCTPKELISWLKCLKFVRNVCAHNSNIIDIKLNTTPLIADEWKDVLFKFKGTNGRYTDRIAVVICVLQKMMKSVNPSYNYGKIYSPIKSVSTNDILAQQLGFKSLDTLVQLFPKKKKVRKRLKKRSDNIK
ncbi:Abi family protein [Enterococcus pseudoavium]|uniref:Abi family protein n=1 Tax=Enterococcus pseudoavium TaxID=44007 RepID=A0AAE4L764_9ENTE|nr:Abi family protein [Enterococcus pseudoavium]MDT2737972.1 Abi family protein [Enterococcus pseudoavium]